MIERGHQRYAVVAGFLGWTFDAFDFFDAFNAIELFDVVDLLGPLNPFDPFDSAPFSDRGSAAYPCVASLCPDIS